jgi:hypothetical protein
MSYLRIIRGMSWLLVAPIFGGVALNACLSDSNSTGSSDNSTSTSTGTDMTGTGSGGDSNPATGAGGDSNPATGAGGSGNPTTGAGGSSATTGAGGAGTGGSTGAGGSTQMMTGSMTGNVKGGVRWVGRFDATNPAAIKFNWGGSGFVANVTATGADVSISMNNENEVYFQPVVDGKVGTRVKAASGMSNVLVATKLAAGAHVIELYRETEAANHGVSTFIGIVGATVGTPPTYSGRLIETIGDSLTNGYGELGIEVHPNFCGAPTINACTYSIETQSNYQSYAAIVARDLNADWSLICNSGWGLYRDRGNGLQNVMPNVWNESYYSQSNPPIWNFSVKADAVIINLGTNDTALGDPGIGYQNALVKFVGTLRTAYGKDTWIFPVTGSMMGSDTIKKLAVWINGAVTQLGDPKVFYVDLGTQDACGAAGTGCDYHPSVAEHKRLATVLLPAIKAKLGW